MRFYWRSRGTLLIASVTALMLGVLLLIDRPLVVFRGSGPIAFLLSVPLQWLTVAVLSLGLSGRMEQFEFSGARHLRALRLLNAGLLLAIGAGAAVIVGFGAVLLGRDPGTVGEWGALRAFLGLFGVACAATAIVDVRIAAIAALPVMLVPLTADTQALPFGANWGFLAAPATSEAAWMTSFLLLVLGIGGYCLGYTERNAPSTNRNALRSVRKSRPAESNA